MRTAISLFAGCGGDTLGLESAGFKVLAYSEKWAPAAASHEANFPGCVQIGAVVNGDIARTPDSEFEPFAGQVDILFAGFPCQGFSHAGKKDPNDPRNRLFWEFVRAADVVRPRWVIGENVSGLLKRLTDDRATYISEVITSAFEEIGYRMASPFVLNAVQFGVPQARRRVFFVGSRDGSPFRQPSPSHGRINKTGRSTGGPFTTIRRFITFSLEGAVTLDPTIVEGGVPSYCESDGVETPTGVPHPYLVSKLKPGLVSARKRLSPFHIEIADLDAPAKTLHSGYSFQPRIFVPLRNRRGTFVRPFTVTELAGIQGFPTHYKIIGSVNQAIVQLGNAVPPPLAAAVVRQVVACDSELSAALSARRGLHAWEANVPTP
jgi:DNA (cytosine-5)-methyltransferase 1